MSDKNSSKSNQDAPRIYQIKLEGHLDARWADWFGDLTITLEDNGITTLTGPLEDQAALYGMLKKIRNVGLTLVSVNLQQREENDEQ